MKWSEIAWRESTKIAFSFRSIHIIEWWGVYSRYASLCGVFYSGFIPLRTKRIDFDGRLTHTHQVQIILMMCLQLTRVFLGSVSLDLNHLGQNKKKTLWWTTHTHQVQIILMMCLQLTRVFLGSVSLDLNHLGQNKKKTLWWTTHTHQVQIRAMRCLQPTCVFLRWSVSLLLWTTQNN